MFGRKRLENEVDAEFERHHDRISHLSLFKQLFIGASIAYVSLFGIKEAEKTIARKEHLAWQQNNVQAQVPVVNHFHSDTLKGEGDKNLIEIVTEYSKQGFLVNSPETNEPVRDIILGPAQHNLNDTNPFYSAIRGESDSIVIEGYANKREPYSLEIPFSRVDEDTISFEYEGEMIKVSEINPFTLRFSFELKEDENIERKAFAMRSVEYTIERGVDDRRYHILVNNISYPIELYERETLEDLLRELVSEEVKLSLQSSQGVSEKEAGFLVDEVYSQYFNTRENLARFFVSPEVFEERMMSDDISEEEKQIYQATKNIIVTAAHPGIRMFHGMGEETYNANKDLIHIIETNGYANALPLYGDFVNRIARNLGARDGKPVVPHEDDHSSYRLGFFYTVDFANLDQENLGLSLKKEAFQGNFIPYEYSTDRILKLRVAFQYAFLTTLLGQDAEK
jgi:hypothetical protein